MERTNESQSGYTYNGQEYQKQNRTDSQGNTYTVDIASNVIPASTLNSQTQPFSTPIPAPATNYNQITADATNPYVEQQAQSNLEMQSSPTGDAVAIQNLMNQASGKSAYEGQQAQSLGLNSANEAYITKQAELTSLAKQAAAAQQENIAQGRQLGSVGSFVAGQGNEIERNRAIKALTIGAELDAIKGNIDVAKMKVQQAVDAKYAGIEQDLANRKAMFDINTKVRESLSKDEQKAYDRAQDALARKDKETAEKKAEEKAISDMVTEAIPNAPTDVIIRAKKLAENGASKLDVAQVLGVYGGDVLKRTLMEEQIKTERSKRQQAEAKASELGVSLPTGLKATAVVKQPVFAKLRAKEQTQAVALDNLIREINHYKSEVNAGGTIGGVNLFGADAARLSSRLNSLLFAAAQAEGTGALQAADKAVLEQSLPNPTTFGGALTNLRQGGLEGMNEKLDVQIQKYTDNMGTLGLTPTYNEFSKATSGMLPPPPGEDISTGTDAQGNMQFSLPTATTSTKKY